MSLRRIALVLGIPVGLFASYTAYLVVPAVVGRVVPAVLDAVLGI
jgi:hypothetical protein